MRSSKHHICPLLRTTLINNITSAIKSQCIRRNACQARRQKNKSAHIDDDNASKPVSFAEVYVAIRKVVQYCDQHELDADVRSIEEVLIDHHASNVIQRRITDYFTLQSNANPSAATGLSLLPLMTSDAGTSDCCVYHNETSGAHRCSDCLLPVHVICGTVNGEEGYGTAVQCNNCKRWYI